MASLPRWTSGALAGLSACATLALGACFAVAPQGIHRETDEGGGGAGGSVIDVGTPPPANLPPDAGTKDPHAVISADPAHGSFAGGDKVLVHGKGFSSKVRVWVGPTEIAPIDLSPIDPLRVQMKVPPGKAGAADITVQNGDDASTKRTLKGGYTYDALYAEPNSGPVPGGTVIEIIGQNTAWNASTTATVDQKPCVQLKLESPTVLTCTVPPGAPGTKAITVKTGSETISVLDAYTYEDSDNGYKGGLSGAPLAGHLKVLVYDNYSGNPVPGAHVIVGSEFGTALKQDADAKGVAVFDDPSLTKPVTVTIAALCHSPISFVSNPVDTVTSYIDPVLSPACLGSGDPPPIGGKPAATGEITGQLVWPGGVEFKKGKWSNVPPVASPDEKRVAYVFYATESPTQPFQLPTAEAAVTEDSPGDIGYGFSLKAPAGNRAVYALCGIENRVVNPPKFTAYVMGIVTGVPVLPNTESDGIYLSMTKTLDHVLSLDVHTPAPSAKGPDRLRANIALMLGNDGYALLPIGQKMPFLPVQGLLDFVGVPSLDGELLGTSYITVARAQTGPNGQPPLSVIAKILTTSTSQPVPVDNFVNLPQLTTPAISSAWDGRHLATTFPPGGESIEITVYDIQSGNGLVHWTVAVPGTPGAIELPDLSSYPESAMPPGPLSIAVIGGHHKVFDYSKLLYRQMRTYGMSAYSLDFFSTHL